MATPNSLDPSFKIVKLPGNIWLTGGASTSSATISAEIGTPGTAMAPGSIYISNATASAEIWIAEDTGWTQLTIN